MLQERKSASVGNNKPFMTEKLSKAKSCLEGTHFRNRFLKNPTDKNRVAFTRQRNFYVSLLRKEKKQYFEKLN